MKFVLLSSHTNSTGISSRGASLMQTDLASFSKPAHVRAVERIQQTATAAIETDPEQLQLPEVRS